MMDEESKDFNQLNIKFFNQLKNFIKEKCSEMFYFIGKD
jgi:hypothetical protein